MFCFQNIHVFLNDSVFHPTKQAINMRSYHWAPCEGSPSTPGRHMGHSQRGLTWALLVRVLRNPKGNPEFCPHVEVPYKGKPHK